MQSKLIAQGTLCDFQLARLAMGKWMLVFYGILVDNVVLKQIFPKSIHFSFRFHYSNPIISTDNLTKEKKAT